MIKKESTLAEVFSSCPKAPQILSSILEDKCFACPMAHEKTLQEVLQHHGLSEEEIEKIVEKLNNKIKD